MSKLTTLLLGAALGVAATATVAAIRLTAPTGSAILTGNQYFVTGDNPTPSINVDNTPVLKPTKGGLQFPDNGTQTGVSLKDANGNVAEFSRFFPCTNTGGLAKYPTCLAKPLLTLSGSITQISFECGKKPGTNKVLTMSGGFVLTSTQPVGALTGAFLNARPLSAFSGVSLKIGSNTGTTIPIWNPAWMIKFQTTTAFPAGGINCGLYIKGHYHYGS